MTADPGPGGPEQADPSLPQPSGYLLSINTNNQDSMLIGPYRSLEKCEADRHRIDLNIRALDAEDVRFTTIEPLYSNTELIYIREQLVADLREMGYTKGGA